MLAEFDFSNFNKPFDSSNMSFGIEDIFALLIVLIVVALILGHGGGGKGGDNNKT